MANTATQEPAEKLHKPEQVAQRFEVSRTKIYELMRTGELRSVRIGGSRRIPESAVSEFLACLKGS